MSSSVVSWSDQQLRMTELACWQSTEEQSHFYLMRSCWGGSRLCVLGVMVVVMVTPCSVPGLGHVNSGGVGGHVGVEVVDGGAVAVDGVGGGDAEVRPLQVVSGHRVLPGVFRDGGPDLGVEGDGEGGAHSILVGVAASVDAGSDCLGGTFVGQCRACEDH